MDKHNTGSNLKKRVHVFRRVFFLTIVMMNKLRWHAHCQMSANQIT